jgi:hypothetical protein
MQSSSAKLHLIVAPEYGERLTGLPCGEPVWVADTPSNKSVIQRMWSQKREGITSFQVAPAATPEDWLLSVLDQVELHHGEYSQSPPYSALQVVGTGMPQRLRAELESCGFKQFEDTRDGFIAHKATANNWLQARPGFAWLFVLAPRPGLP